MDIKFFGQNIVHIVYSRRSISTEDNWVDESGITWVDENNERWVEDNVYVDETGGIWIDENNEDWIN